MIEKILSFYHPNYFGALAYLLQSNEYNTKLYLRSYWGMRDLAEFSESSAKKTTKAFMGFQFLALAIAAMIYALGGLFITRSLGDSGGFEHLTLGLGLIVGQPVITAHLLLIPLLIGNILFRAPREQMLVASATKIFAEHEAIKIGVAGSFGKTTTKEILANVLGSKFKVAYTPGNNNTPVGISRFAKTLNGDEEVLIVEMGEYVPGEITKICNIVDPTIGIITGVNEQHMQRMKTIENTIDTIFELADHVGEGMVLVNAESELSKNASRKGHILFSAKQAGAWKATKPKSDLSGTSFTAVKGKRSIKLHSQLLGKHQIGALLAAVAIADKLKLTTAQIKKGIEKTKPEGRRFNPMEIGKNSTFIDDTYNGNPDGFKVGIEFLDGLKAKRKVYITGGLIELGNDKERIHRWLGTLLAKSKIERIMLIKTPATVWMAEGIEQADPGRTIEWIEPEAKIYQNLDQYVSDGDVILMQNWQREKIFYEL